mmetsp:Transcript_76146/g.246604  ORF Transcript_76146/g.246604 Transcript_76146/m.246604 type:complete len:151 (-) Transcript_76146:1107-1559(-)
MAVAAETVGCGPEARAACPVDPAQGLARAGVERTGLHGGLRHGSAWTRGSACRHDCQAHPTQERAPGYSVSDPTVLEHGCLEHHVRLAKAMTLECGLESLRVGLHQLTGSFAAMAWGKLPPQHCLMSFSSVVGHTATAAPWESMCSVSSR